jgi:hypothetical protein
MTGGRARQARARDRRRSAASMRLGHLLCEREKGWRKLAKWWQVGWSFGPGGATVDPHDALA